LKSPNRNDLDPYNPQYDVAIDLSSKLYWSKLISILFKIRDVVYIQITNISLASRLSCRSRSLTAVTLHIGWHERHVILSLVILYYICTSMDGLQQKMRINCKFGHITFMVSGDGVEEIGTASNTTRFEEIMQNALEDVSDFFIFCSTKMD